MKEEFTSSALIQMLLTYWHVGRTSLGELGSESGSTDAPGPSIYA